jgi:hypothetical protein
VSSLFWVPAAAWREREREREIERDRERERERERERRRERDGVTSGRKSSIKNVGWALERKRKFAEMHWQGRQIKPLGA